jgi:hypothetical protein
VPEHGHCQHAAWATMGRGPSDDPWFFAAAFGAGRLAGTFVT